MPARLQAAYDAAMEDGLWKDTYAATNSAEYWAEATQSWFGTNRDNDRLHNHVDTRDEVKEYDPRVTRLLSDVYGDGEWRYSRADRRWTQPHFTTWDESQAPRFAWPAEVTQRYDALKKGDSVSIATLVDAGMETLTLSNEATFVSQGQGKKVSVMFVNETDEPIQLWWVKPDDSLKDYGQIAKRSSLAVGRLTGTFGRFIRPMDVLSAA